MPLTAERDARVSLPALLCALDAYRHYISSLGVHFDVAEQVDTVLVFCQAVGTYSGAGDYEELTIDYEQLLTFLRSCVSVAHARTIRSALVCSLAMFPLVVGRGRGRS